MTEDWPVRPAERLFFAQEKAEIEHVLAQGAEAHPGLGLYLLRPPIVLGPHAMGAKARLPGPMQGVGARLGALVMEVLRRLDGLDDDLEPERVRAAQRAVQHDEEPDPRGPHADADPDPHGPVHQRAPRHRQAPLGARRLRDLHGHVDRVRPGAAAPKPRPTPTPDPGDVRPCVHVQLADGSYLCVTG